MQLVSLTTVFFFFNSALQSLTKNILKQKFAHVSLLFKIFPAVITYRTGNEENTHQVHRPETTRDVGEDVSILVMPKTTVGVEEEWAGLDHPQQVSICSSFLDCHALLPHLPAQKQPLERMFYHPSQG